MKHLVFVDIDGTLLPPCTNEVPESTISAFWNLKHNNTGIILCTGRHFKEIEQLGLLSFPYDGFVTLNGQVCLNESYSCIKAYPIKGKSRERLINLFNSKKVPVVISEMDSIYLNFTNDLIQRVLSEIATDVYPLGVCSKSDIYMASIYSESNPLNNCKDLVFDHWNQFAMDVYPEKGGKVTGMKVFMDYYNVERENTIAFGDEDNDIEMLKYARIGIAMGNGNQTAKDAADYVTDNVNNNGIAKALEQLIVV